MRDDLAELRQSFQLNNTAPSVKSRGEQQATQVDRKLLRNEADKKFASREAANAFCANLKKRGQDCLVRKQN